MKTMKDAMTEMTAAHQTVTQTMMMTVNQIAETMCANQVRMRNPVQKTADQNAAMANVKKEKITGIVLKIVQSAETRYVKQEKQQTTAALTAVVQ